MRILPIEDNDFENVLALNDESIPGLNHIGIKELQWYCDHADCVQVAILEERFAGFLIGLRPGSDYASPNYRWFCDNYKDFAYVDRVAVSEWARRRGVAEAMYKAFAASQSGVPVMTCEVNIRPPNEGSMKYHERLGFRQVASQEIDGGQKKVALMEKIL